MKIDTRLPGTADKPVQPVTWMRRLRDDPDVTEGRLLILWALAMRMDGSTGTGWCSVETLMADTGLSKRTVLRAVGWATDNGWMVRLHRGHRLGNGRAVASTYQLTAPSDESSKCHQGTVEDDSQGAIGASQGAIGAPQGATGAPLSAPLTSAPFTREPVVAEDRDPTPRTKKTKRRTEYPDDWKADNEAVEFAREKKLDLSFEADQFKSDAKAKGWTLVDWDEAFMKWLRNAARFQSRDEPPVPSYEPQPITPPSQLPFPSPAETARRMGRSRQSAAGSALPP